jgi:hypothetical protein
MYVVLSREPTGWCDLCGVPVYSTRDLIAHFQTANHRLAYATALADRHDVKTRLRLFHEPQDPEIEEHMKRVGKRMLQEGRWTVHPSEKAGF